MTIQQVREPSPETWLPWVTWRERNKKQLVIKENKKEEEVKVAVLLKEVKFKIKEGVNGSYRRKTLVCDFEMKTKLSHYNCIKCGKEISCKSDFLLPKKVG